MHERIATCCDSFLYAVVLSAVGASARRARLGRYCHYKGNHAATYQERR
jgi:hypothetical protein